jgi:hypothetical protein
MRKLGALCVLAVKKSFPEDIGQDLQDRESLKNPVNPVNLVKRTTRVSSHLISRVLSH